MVDAIAQIPLRLTAYFDVEKGDGRILRYWIDEDPPCPKCGAKGCKEKIMENGKLNDWIRVCQCGHEFSLIERIK